MCAEAALVLISAALIVESKGSPCEGTRIAVGSADGNRAALWMTSLVDAC